MKKKILITTVASLGLMVLFACSQKDVKLQAPVKDDVSGKWGYADSTGKVVTSFIYEEADSFKDGLSKVKLNGKQGFIDIAGKEAVPIIYDEIGDYIEGISMAKLDGKYGFLDKNGNNVIPFLYEEADTFMDGLAKVKLNGKQGFIDKVGKEVIPLIYDEVGVFSGGILMVGIDGKYGYLDKSGKEVLPLIYDSAGSFSNGRAKVQQDDKYYFINKEGEILPAEMYLEFVYRQTGQNVNGTPVAKLDSFVFKDMVTREQLTYKKLVINGATVISTRCYAESGMNGMNVAEFSLSGGKSVGYRIALGHTKTLAYKLENGTLTIL